MFYSLLWVQTTDALVNAGHVKLEIADRKRIGSIYAIDSIIISEQYFNAIPSPVRLYKP